MLIGLDAERVSVCLDVSSRNSTRCSGNETPGSFENP